MAPNAKYIFQNTFFWFLMVQPVDIFTLAEPGPHSNHASAGIDGGGFYNCCPTSSHMMSSVNVSIAAAVVDETTNHSRVPNNL